MKTSHAFTLGLTTMLGLALLPANARATLIVDSFDATMQVLQSSTVGTTTTAGPAPEAVGAHRQLDLIVDTAPNSSTNKLGVHVMNNGRLVHAEATNGDGGFRIIWDGNDDVNSIDTVGLAPLDLTENGASTGIEIIAKSDHSFDIELIVHSGPNSSSLTQSIPASMTLDSHIFLYEDFIGAADFADVGAIELVVDTPGVMEIDLEIDIIGTFQPPAVPEPSTLVLLLAGLAISAARRRRG